MNNILQFINNPDTQYYVWDKVTLMYGDEYEHYLSQAQTASATTLNRFSSTISLDLNNRKLILNDAHTVYVSYNNYANSKTEFETNYVFDGNPQYDNSVSKCTGTVVRLRDGNWYLVKMTSNEGWTIPEDPTITEVRSTTKTYPDNGLYGDGWYTLKQSPRPVPSSVTDSNLFGGVEYEISINSSDDLTVGDSASARLTFVTDRSDLSTGDAFEYRCKQQKESSYRTIGKFIITDIVREKNRYRVTAYDYMSRFDKNIDSFLAGITWPISMSNLFKQLCQYCGVSYGSTTFINNDLSIGNNFATKNVTARQILGYIAGAAGGFAMCDANGTVQIKTFPSTSSHTFNNSEYIEFEHSDFVAPVINKVWIGISDTDLGITSGTGDNVLKIAYNPMLFNGDTTVIQTAADNIYNKVNTYRYTPVSIKLFKDYSVNVGDKITIDNIDSYIFTKKITSSGVVLESTGNAVRDESINEENSEILQLRGKYNSLVNTVVEHTREIGDLGTSITTVSQKADGIQIEVDDLQTDMTNTLTFNNEGLIVKKDQSSVQINGGNINLTGHIQFSDLAPETVRKVGNILRQSTVPTGSDLVDGLLWLNTGSEIHSGGYVFYPDSWYSYTGGKWILVNNPSYITSTYIDATTIKSPTIQGNNVVVDGTSGGCFQVQRNGATTGYMGVGTDYNIKTGNIEYGIAMANDLNGNTYLDDGDYFIIITGANARMQAGNHAIYVNEDGAFVRDYNSGTDIPLGYATFA